MLLQQLTDSSRKGGVSLAENKRQIFPDEQWFLPKKNEAFSKPEETF